MIKRKVLSEAFQGALQGWRLRAAVFRTASTRVARTEAVLLLPCGGGDISR